jgi:hypothetical protein
MSEGKFDPAAHLSNKVRGGADYLEVKWRLVWLRSEHPDAAIATELVRETDNSALFKASVSIPGGGSATGFGSETAKDFGDFIEKAETKAVGRALAMLGYGTQFVGEDLDEGDRIVDAPVERPAPTRAANTPRAGERPGREYAPRRSERPTDRPAAVPSAAGPPSSRDGKRVPTFAEARRYALDETISAKGRLRAATIALELAGSLDELADTYSKVMALPEREGLKETYGTRHKALKELDAVPF